MLKHNFIIAALISLSALLLFSCTQKPIPPSLEAATLLPQQKSLPNFKLTHFGEGEFTNKQLLNKWSLFFFGYTRCPDVCPTELYQLSNMMKQIEAKPDLVSSIPQVVFVSVDPQQDKPQALSEYAQFYHPKFLGVTGAQSEVDKLAKSMFAYYERAYHDNQGKLIKFKKGEKIPKELENAYLINHSASIVLVNPKGKLHAVFSSPHEPSTMIRDLAAIQKAWNE